MELLLNALWVVLALLAVGNWRARGGHRRLGAVQAALALTCALLLLFPIISASDDLHGVALFTDDSPQKRLVCHAADTLHPVAAVAAPHVTLPAPATGWTERAETSRLPAPLLLLPRSDSRAPPSLVRS